MALPGVVGTAIGLCDGVACIRVFLADSSAAARGRIPAQLDGYSVKVEVTGPIGPRRPPPPPPPPPPRPPPPPTPPHHPNRAARPPSPHTATAGHRPAAAGPPPPPPPP